MENVGADNQTEKGLRRQMADSSGLVHRIGESAIGVLPDGPRISLRRALRKNKERARLKRADLTVIAHPKSGSTFIHPSAQTVQPC